MRLERSPHPASPNLSALHPNSTVSSPRYENTFDIPFNGEMNDDPVSGEGFCCRDNLALRSGNIGGGNDNPEIYQYYYHSDHLGSTSLITNLDGEVTQHVEYTPWGEVFIEERNNDWHTPFLFNAKELDEETGLYYYGARYYDPRGSVFLSVDPMREEYPEISPYAYCNNNPVMYVDPDGNQAVAAMGDPPKNESVLSQWVNHLRDLFTINLDLSSPEKRKQSVEVQQAKNQEIQAYTEAIETFNSVAGMIFPVVGSAAEIMANAESGNSEAALAAVPWLLLDVATAGKGNSVKGVKVATKTQWGWTGTKIWNSLVNKIKGGGTIEKLNGKIPTSQEAKMLLKDAGVDMSKIREELGHKSPNPHNYPHINYTTPNGNKGTIQIKGVTE